MTCCAYVGIHTESAFEVPVLKKVKQIEGVTEAYRVYGIYDILAKLKTNRKCELKKIVAEEIIEIERVRGVTTIILELNENILPIRG